MTDFALILSDEERLDRGTRSVEVLGINLMP
jgi:hypothetical protein